MIRGYVTILKLSGTKDREMKEEKGVREVGEKENFLGHLSKTWKKKEERQSAQVTQTLIHSSFFVPCTHNSLSPEKRVLCVVCPVF